MRKANIELTEEQYFFLKKKALEFKKQNASIVPIIRDPVEKDSRELTQREIAKEKKLWCSGRVNGAARIC
jgi:hypothetical protein